MSIYLEGTASVTNGSKVVTGAGTEWFGAMSQGWLFNGPDGALYVIDEVNDSGKITLHAPYAGATAAAQSYFCFATQSLGADLINRLQTLFNTYQTKAETVLQGRFTSDLVFNTDRDTGMGNPSPNELGLKAGDVWQLLLKNGQAAGAAVQSSASDAGINKLMTNGAHGLGASVIEYTGDIDDPAGMPTGFYRITALANGTKPPALVAFNIIQVRRSTSEPYADTYQIALSNQSSSYIRSRRADGGWTSWAKTLVDLDVQANTADATAGRLMMVGALGLGGNALPPPNNDLDQIGAASGLYYGDGVQENTPPQFGNSLVLHIARNSEIWTQIAINRGAGDNRIVTRRKTGAGAIPSPWSELMILDENGRTAQNIEIKNSGPFISITDLDTGAKHTLSGNSTAGHLYIKTDPAQTMLNSALLIETQGVRQMVVSKNNVEFEVPIKGELDCWGPVRAGVGAAGANALMEIGSGRTADGPSYIDLIGDTVYHNYGARIIRNSGENGSTTLSARGSGNFNIQSEEPANLVLKTDTRGVGRGAVIDPIGNLRPSSDNAQSCGSGSFRWSQVYAASGTINTSDARIKTDIQDLDAAERRVALVAKSLLKKYRIRDAVAAKGDAARWHFGVIAQELAAAFEAEGLDPWRYGVLCWDEWWSAMVEIPAETAPIMEEVEEEITHTVTVEEPVLDEHGEPTGEVQQVEKEVLLIVKKQVETGELEILTEARTELQTFASAEEAPEGAEYHDRQGVRYDELFAFILAAM